MLLHKIYGFLNKYLNKHILLTGKNSFKRKFMINCILKHCKNRGDFCSKENCLVYSSFKLKSIKFIFNKRKNIKISFIIEKIIGLSKFSRNKIVIIFYQICNINKSKQIHLLKEINKVKKKFFFIFTSNNTKKISFIIKKNVLVFPLDGLNFLLKKNKSRILKFKCITKKNIRPVYRYTWFLEINLLCKNFDLHNKLLDFFFVRNFNYIDIFNILKIIRMITYAKKINVFSNFQTLYLKNNFCFIWNRLKNLILKFYHRIN